MKHKMTSSMKSIRHILLWWIGMVVGFFLHMPSAEATHIVGGEMRYEFLGDDLYRIYFSMRRDCYNGAPDAQFDPNAAIALYDIEGNLLRAFGLNGVLLMPFNPDDTLNEMLNSECQVIGEDVCVHTTTYNYFSDGSGIFSGVLRLPFREGGYYIVYQRCCRNKIDNIFDPENTGATYWVYISEEALRLGNTSARFKNWAPIYWCSGRDFVFDHSAVDPDGDSLVYRLCVPYAGGDRNHQKPVPPPSPRTWELVRYKPPYGLNNLFGGTPLTIDPTTGIMRGVPQETGTFLIGVCVEEYRNGKLINVVRRDFEINIRICPEKPIADFFADTIVCEGLTVQFTNNSSGGNFRWYFQANRDRSQFSTDENPSYTYPGPGEYRVVLIAERDSLCVDSAEKTIYVYGDGGYGADFDYQVSHCEDSVVLELQSMSFDRRYTIIDDSLHWRVRYSGGVFRATGQRVRFVHHRSDTVEVQLTLYTQGGCVDSMTQTIPIHILDIDFISDSVAICFGDTARIIDTVDEQFQYRWSPSNSLSCADCPNPLAFPDRPTRYNVTISDGLCAIERSVFVKVNELLDIDVLGDSIACTERIRLHTNGGVESTVEWSNRRDFSQILKRGSYTIDLNIHTSDTVIYVRAVSQNNCPGMDSIHISNQIVRLSFVDSIKPCVYDTVDIRVANQRPEHVLNYQWTPADVVVRGQGTGTIVAYFDKVGRHTLHFTATNQYGCSDEGEIIVDVQPLPDVGFRWEHDCDSLEVRFTNLSESGRYQWDFGDGQSSMETHPVHVYKQRGRYRVTLIVEGYCVNAITQTVEVGYIPEFPPDTVISCEGAPVELWPDAPPQYRYRWHPQRGLSDPHVGNPIARVDTTSIYTVTVTDTSYPDCQVERSVLLLVPPAISYEISDDTILCYSDSTYLGVRSDLPLTYEWRDASGVLIDTTDTLLVHVDKPTTFYVLLKDSYGCYRLDSVRVIPYFLNVEILMPPYVCYGHEAEIGIVNKGGGPLTYRWMPSDVIVDSTDIKRIRVRVDTTTEFVLKIRHKTLGCMYELYDTLVVSRVRPKPIATATPDTIYLGQKSQLEVQVGYTSYEWDPSETLSCDNCNDPVAMPDSTTRYTVYVTNDSNCLDSASVLVVVKRPTCDDNDIYIPNAFSPNGDGINDEWTVFSNFIDSIHVMVYDRWGEKVFETKRPGESWDGTYQGKRLPPDVYAVRVYVYCVDGQEFVKTGNVTILR